MKRASKFHVHRHRSRKPKRERSSRIFVPCGKFLVHQWKHRITFFHRTNVLEPYTDKDIYIRLPDKRKITSIKWLAIWNLRDQENYGDIYLPDGFEPPAPRKLSELTRQGGGVKSGTVVIMDTKTILLPHFHFNGENNG